MGEESDADWQAGLVEWGREAMDRMSESMLYGGTRSHGKSTAGTLTIDDLREAMRKVDALGSACPFREVVCNERMRADARLVHQAIPGGTLGGIPVRYSNAVPDGYIVLTDGEKVVAIIGPEKQK